MVTLTIFLQKDTDLGSPSINNVSCAKDNSDAKRIHSNQYQKPEGGLYSYQDYVNYLVKRFKYEQVIIQCRDERTILWTAKSK